MYMLVHIHMSVYLRGYQKSTMVFYFVFLPLFCDGFPLSREHTTLGCLIMRSWDSPVPSIEVDLRHMHLHLAFYRVLGI